MSTRTLSQHRGRKAARQRGLTLIELIVVLTILVALGSLLVPVVRGALARSHVATCATSFPEVTKMLLTTEVVGTDYGDGWTTGVDQTGTSVNNATTGTLTADEVDALNELGIENVFNHNTAEADYNVTFNAGLTGVTLDDTTDVIVLTDPQAESIYLQAAGDEKYVWLGIDKSWTKLGDAAPEPPVHFGDAEGALPHQVYSRFGAIFQVADAAGDALDVAKFKRVSYTLDGEEFETADNHIGVHWQEVHGNN
jgi:prepilin-type N-terminal cleavage/methylation domain-containing protein